MRLNSILCGGGGGSATIILSGRICEVADDMARAMSEPCHAPRQPLAEKIGGGSLLNRPSCPPDDPIGRGTEIN